MPPGEAAALGSACVWRRQRDGPTAVVTPGRVLRQDACGLSGRRFVQLVSGCDYTAPDCFGRCVLRAALVDGAQRVVVRLVAFIIQTKSALHLPNIRVALGLLRNACEELMQGRGQRGPQSSRIRTKFALNAPADASKLCKRAARCGE